MTARLLTPPSSRTPRLVRSSRLRALLRVSLALTALATAILPVGALASVEGELAFHEAVAAYGEGDLARAREGFERALQDDPEDASALHYLGLIAVRRGDTAGAIRHLEQAVRHAPSRVAIRVDLGAQYLKTRRNGAALEQFDIALGLDPEHALATLYQGIALYRQRMYSASLDSFERVESLDPTLANEASFYRGLANAYLGNAAAAASAFDTAADGAPQSPLGRSAANLHTQAARSARPWSLAMTTGLEYNDNVRLSSGKRTNQQTLPPPKPTTSDSGAAVLRLQGQAEPFQNDALNWRVGYDGYLQIYWDTKNEDLSFNQEFAPYDLSQQTHVVWTNGTWDTPWASFALRYDFSYTALDLTKSFRTIQRVAPTVYVPVSEWGLFVSYYQFLYYDYDFDIETSNPDAFDRSGPQHSVGAQQFVFLPDPINYLVASLLWTTFDSDGTEFRHDGIEVSFGGEIKLPWQVSLAALYRFEHREYSENSVWIGPPAPPKKRDDDEHEISFSLERPIGRRFNVSIAGSYGDNLSNIREFDIDRVIIGTYLRYSF